MTDRIGALTVALERDIREDDVQVITSAILCLRGVLRVRTHVADHSAYVAQSRLVQKLRKALLQVIEDMEGGAE